MIKTLLILSIWFSSTLFVKINFYEIDPLLSESDIFKLVFNNAYENDANPELKHKMNYTDTSLSLYDLESTLSHLSAQEKNIHGYFEAINAKMITYGDQNDLNALTKKIQNNQPMTFIYPCDCGDGSNYIAIPINKIKIDCQLNIITVPHINIQFQYFNESQNHLKEICENPIEQVNLTYAIGLNNSLSLMSYKRNSLTCLQPMR